MFTPIRALLAFSLLFAISSAGATGTAEGKTCYLRPNCTLGNEPYIVGPKDIFGGGSSVGAPWWRQMSDCYANPADLFIVTGPSFVDTRLFDYKGRSPQNCDTTEIKPGRTSWYVSNGSGIGILAFFGHDPTLWGRIRLRNGYLYLPGVSYALSGAGLTRRDVDDYDRGTGDKPFCVAQGRCIALAALNAQNCDTIVNGTYPNPLQCFGPMVQFPVSIDPIAISYTNGGVYEKISGEGLPEIDYRFNVQNGTQNGGLRLSVSSLCGIYGGQITNWNDSRLTSDNDGVSLEDPTDPTPTDSWSVPLEPAGRFDPSGSTLAFSRHLAAVCSSFGLHIKPAETLGGAGLGPEISCDNPVPGGILVAAGSTGVAQCVNFSASPYGMGDDCPGAVLLVGYTDCIQQGRAGYIGADYVLPHVSKNGMNKFGLYAAQLENASGGFIAPSPNAALIAFGQAGLPPQTDTNGNYCPKCGSLKRKNPWDWNPQALLADPPQQGAYPMIGTTNFLGYSCYRETGQIATLIGQLKYLETAAINTERKDILESSGVAVLPNTWRTAIERTFITNRDRLGLQITKAGGGSANCSVAQQGG